MQKTEKINLVLTNKNVNKNSVIKFKLDNFSNVNYFLPLSGFDFENNFYEKKLYSSIFLQPVFSNEDGEVILPKNNRVLVKHTKESGNLYFECLENEIKKSDNHFKRFNNLSQHFKIKSNSTTLFSQKIFNFNFINCNFLNTKAYDFLQNKKYFIHFEYQLNKEYYYSKVYKKSRDKLEKQGYQPYFERLISNKVPFVVEEDK